MASPAWVVADGQCGTVTAPPVTAAAARKGVALDRSGSMAAVHGPTGPGRTRQVFGSSASTRTPTAQSAATVIRMCGSDGSGPPRCSTRTPSVNDAPDSRSPETNWEDALASMVTVPPGSAPVPCRVNGKAPPSMEAPRARSASSTMDIGRRRAAGSPSKVISPFAVAASAGRNRMTVPARPQSITAGPDSGAGSTSQSAPSPVMSWVITVPSARNAAAINSVSRLRRAPISLDGPVAWAARISARLVRDFEPGTVTVAVTGRVATGTDQPGRTGAAAADRGPDCGPVMPLLPVLACSPAHDRAWRASPGRGTPPGSAVLGSDLGQFGDPAGDVVVLAEVVARAHPVIPVCDLQRETALQRAADQQHGRQLLAGLHRADVLGDVLVVRRQQLQAGGPKDVLGLEMPQLSGLQGVHRRLHQVRCGDQGQVGRGGRVVVLVRF